MSYLNKYSDIINDHDAIDRAVRGGILSFMSRPEQAQLIVENAREEQDRIFQNDTINLPFGVSNEFLEFTKKFIPDAKFKPGIETHAHGPINAIDRYHQHKLEKSLRVDTSVVHFGGKLSKTIGAKAADWHECSPILSSEDCKRREFDIAVALTERAEEHVAKIADAKAYCFDPTTVCHKKCQDCDHPADVIIAQHSVYNVTVEEAYQAMLSHGAREMYISLIFVPELLLLDVVEIPVLGLKTYRTKGNSKLLVGNNSTSTRTDMDNVVFVISDGSQDGNHHYEHSWPVYKQWLEVLGTHFYRGNTFTVERLDVRGCMARIKIHRFPGHYVDQNLSPYTPVAFSSFHEPTVLLSIDWSADGGNEAVSYLPVPRKLYDQVINHVSSQKIDIPLGTLIARITSYVNSCQSKFLINSNSFGSNMQVVRFDQRLFVTMIAVEALQNRTIDQNDLANLARKKLTREETTAHESWSKYVLNNLGVHIWPNTAGWDPRDRPNLVLKSVRVHNCVELRQDVTCDLIDQWVADQRTVGEVMKTTLGPRYYQRPSPDYNKTRYVKTEPVKIEVDMFDALAKFPFWSALDVANDRAPRRDMYSCDDDTYEKIRWTARKIVDNIRAEGVPQRLVHNTGVDTLATLARIKVYVPDVSGPLVDLRHQQKYGALCEYVTISCLHIENTQATLCGWEAAREDARESFKSLRAFDGTLIFKRKANGEFDLPPHDYVFAKGKFRKVRKDRDGTPMFIEDLPEDVDTIITTDVLMYFHAYEFVNRFAAFKTVVLPNYFCAAVKGVPGCGKTKIAVQMLKPGDIITTQTVTGKVDLLKRVVEEHPEFDSSAIKTLSSCILNAKKANRIICDEAYMAHYGAYAAACMKTGATSAVLLGDDQQIPFISFIGDFKGAYWEIVNDIEYNIPISLRIPRDCAVAISHNYGFVVRTINTVRRSIHVHFTSDYLSIIKQFPGATVVVFEQHEKKDIIRLMRNVPGEYVIITAAESQGLTVRHVIIIRTSTKTYPIHRVINKILMPHTLVGTSRPTHRLDYITVTKDDEYARHINPDDISDEALDEVGATMEEWEEIAGGIVADLNNRTRPDGGTRIVELKDFDGDYRPHAIGIIGRETAATIGAALCYIHHDGDIVATAEKVAAVATEEPVISFDEETCNNLGVSPTELRSILTSALPKCNSIFRIGSVGRAKLHPRIQCCLGTLPARTTYDENFVARTYFEPDTDEPNYADAETRSYPTAKLSTNSAGRGSLIFAEIDSAMPNLFQGKTSICNLGIFGDATRGIIDYIRAARPMVRVIHCADEPDPAADVISTGPSDTPSVDFAVLDTGVADYDKYYAIAFGVLKVGSNAVVRLEYPGDIVTYRKVKALAARFSSVWLMKPITSRPYLAEFWAVCRSYEGPTGEPIGSTDTFDTAYNAFSKLAVEQAERWKATLIQCCRDVRLDFNQKPLLDSLIQQIHAGADVRTSFLLCFCGGCQADIHLRKDDAAAWYKLYTTFPVNHAGWNIACTQPDVYVNEIVKFAIVAAFNHQSVRFNTNPKICDIVYETLSARHVDAYISLISNTTFRPKVVIPATGLPIPWLGAQEADGTLILDSGYTYDKPMRPPFAKLVDSGGNLVINNHEFLATNVMDNYALDEYIHYKPGDPCWVIAAYNAWLAVSRHKKFGFMKSPDGSTKSVIMAVKAFVNNFNKGRFNLDEPHGDAYALLDAMAGTAYYLTTRKTVDTVIAVGYTDGSPIGHYFTRALDGTYHDAYAHHDNATYRYVNLSRIGAGVDQCAYDSVSHLLRDSDIKFDHAPSGPADARTVLRRAIAASDELASASIRQPTEIGNGKYLFWRRQGVQPGHWFSVDIKRCVNDTAVSASKTIRHWSNIVRPAAVSACYAIGSWSCMNEIFRNQSFKAVMTISVAAFRLQNSPAGALSNATNFCVGAVAAQTLSLPTPPTINYLFPRAPRIVTACAYGAAFATACHLWRKVSHRVGVKAHARRGESHAMDGIVCAVGPTLIAADAVACGTAWATGRSYYSLATYINAWAFPAYCRVLPGYVKRDGALRTWRQVAAGTAVAVAMFAATPTIAHRAPHLLPIWCNFPAVIISNIALEDVRKAEVAELHCSDDDISHETIFKAIADYQPSTENVYEIFSVTTQPAITYGHHGEHMVAVRDLAGAIKAICDNYSVDFDMVYYLVYDTLMLTSSPTRSVYKTRHAFNLIAKAIRYLKGDTAGMRVDIRCLETLSVGSEPCDPPTRTISPLSYFCGRRAVVLSHVVPDDEFDLSLVNFYDIHAGETYDADTVLIPPVLTNLDGQWFEHLVSSFAHGAAFYYLGSEPRAVSGPLVYHGTCQTTNMHYFTLPDSIWRGCRATALIQGPGYEILAREMINQRKQKAINVVEHVGTRVYFGDAIARVLEPITVDPVSRSLLGTGKSFGAFAPDADTSAPTDGYVRTFEEVDCNDLEGKRLEIYDALNWKGAIWGDTARHRCRTQAPALPHEETVPTASGSWDPSYVAEIMHAKIPGIEYNDQTYNAEFSELAPKIFDGLSGVTIDMSKWNAEVITKHPTCPPVFRTAEQPPRINTAAEFLNSAAKRNLNPVKLRASTDPVQAARMYLDNFYKYMCVPDVSARLDEFRNNPIRPSPSCTNNWLTTRDAPQIAKIDVDKIVGHAEASLTGALSSYRAMIKAQPKAKIDESILNNIPALQIILAHEPEVNCLYGPEFAEVTERLKSILSDGIIMAIGYSRTDMERILNNYVDDFSAAGLHHAEVDTTNMDKSQDVLWHHVMTHMYADLGLDEKLGEIWAAADIFSINICREHGIYFHKECQNCSGRTSTTFQNCATAGVSFANVVRQRPKWLTKIGDDIISKLLNNAAMCNGDVQEFSRRFNLAVKALDYKVPYFSGSYLIKGSKGLKIMRDFYRVVNKFGGDVKSAEEMYDKWKSFVDTVSCYDDEEYNILLSRAICERENVTIDLTFAMNGVYVMAQSFEEFAANWQGFDRKVGTTDPFERCRWTYRGRLYSSVAQCVEKITELGFAEACEKRTMAVVGIVQQLCRDNLPLFSAMRISEGNAVVTDDQICRMEIVNTGVLSMNFLHAFEFNGRVFDSIARAYEVACIEHHGKATDERFDRTTPSKLRRETVRLVGVMNDSWTSVKVDVMRRVIRSRCESDARFNSLVSSSTKPFVLKGKDAFWGTGNISADDTFTGNNWYGRLLTELAIENNHKYVSIWRYAYIKLFRLGEKAIRSLADGTVTTTDGRTAYLIDSRNDPLGNDFRCEMTIGGVEYTSVTQRYYHAMCVCHEETDKAAKVLETDNCDLIRRIARRTKHCIYWDFVRRDTLREALTAKLDHKDIAAFKNALEDAEFIYCDTDKSLGVGYLTKDPRSLDRMLWKGDNYVGGLLQSL